MDSIRGQIREVLIGWLQANTPGYVELSYNLIVLAWIGTVAVLLHVLLHRGVLRLGAAATVGAPDLLKSLHEFSLFSRVALMLQGLIVHLQADLWLATDSLLRHTIEVVTELWLLLFALLALFSVLDAVQKQLRARAAQINFPLAGVVQTVKLGASVLTGLIAISVLMGESPLILLSGIGALSAVLMLIFKDPILGLVAGIQLSANDMLSIGDWLEMPRFGADGEVIEIGLTTVKVQNWDKTITTIPTYALISDSFKNWRGMSESGGRRIKRSILINTGSIGFLGEDQFEQLGRAHLLAPYLSARMEEIHRANAESELDLTVRINGRRLTNVGTFRSYLLAYLQRHPKIRKDMTLMVRQLDPTSAGLPIEIYGFTTTTDWVEYEGIQSDLFDHIFAVLPEFGLRAHEAPTGEDLRALAAEQT